MRRYLLLSVLTILSACFLSGCFGFSNSEKMVRYYTLEYTPPKMKRYAPLPFSIFVENFNVAPLYDSTKIIYRNTKYQREAYSYHRWRTNPGEMVTQLLARDFKQSSLVKAVFTMDKTFPSSHILKGTVEEFYEKDDKDQWKAILTLNVALIRTDTNNPLTSIVFQKRYTMEEICSKKNPQAFAKAMSQSLRKLSRMIIQDTYNQLLKQKR